MGDIKTILRKSILAGIYISIAGTAYLVVGGILGSVLFAFGLMGVIETSSYLYTGKAGFTKDYLFLGLVLFGNVLGCIMSGFLVSYAHPQIPSTAVAMIGSRVLAGPWVCFLRGIGCGVIMSTIILASRGKNWWPLLYGIPVFILSGFYHSVADAFYISVGWGWFSPAVLVETWIPVVLGNWLGCKLLFLYD